MNPVAVIKHFFAFAYAGNGKIRQQNGFDGPIWNQKAYV